MGSRIYFSGLPTDIDVRALLERFGVPSEGTQIEYSVVTEVIKTEEKGHRWLTVVSRWRKRLFDEHNVILRAGQGRFEAMDPPARVDYGSAKTRSGARALKKAHTVVETTDLTRLTGEQRAQAEHILSITATAIQAARLAAKKPVPSLPGPVAGS